MGPLLLPAVNEVLGEGVLDCLGPRGSRLLFLEAISQVEENRFRVELVELLGRDPLRTDPLELSRVQAARLAPHSVAVLWPGRQVPLRLDPLLVFRGTSLQEEVLFLNADRGRQVEYLSYTTGRTERDRDMAQAMAALLALVGGRSAGIEEGEVAAPHHVVETPFEILGELGSGGMGVVYLARQRSLGRLVALKMLPAGVAGNEVALARFRREIRLLSRCEHPNIVKVLTSGTMPDGQLYYAMEYVPGADLESVWRELSGSDAAGDVGSLGGTTWSQSVLTATRKQRSQIGRMHTPAEEEPAEPGDGPASAVAVQARVPELPLPPLPQLPDRKNDPGGYVRQVVVLMRDAARALQTVHDQNLIHRDVKPANLMLSPDGSRIVLMDFGLAKGQTASITKTTSRGLLGTLRYAAPEQLARTKVPVGPTADIRALGVTPWELLSRRRAFGEAQDEGELTG